VALSQLSRGLECARTSGRCWPTCGSGSIGRTPTWCCSSTGTRSTTRVERAGYGGDHRGQASKRPDGDDPAGLPRPPHPIRQHGQGLSGRPRLRGRPRKKSSSRCVQDRLDDPASTDGIGSVSEPFGYSWIGSPLTWWSAWNRASARRARTCPPSKPVDHTPSVTGCLHQAGKSKLGEMLTGHGGTTLGDLGQGGDIKSCSRSAHSMRTLVGSARSVNERTAAFTCAGPNEPGCRSKPPRLRLGAQNSSPQRTRCPYIFAGSHI